MTDYTKAPANRGECFQCSWKQDKLVKLCKRHAAVMKADAVVPARNTVRNNEPREVIATYCGDTLYIDAGE